MVTGLFQEDETKLFKRVVEPDMTFVDVGAYVGYFTLLASSLIGPAGKVYAFEPDTDAFEFLRANLQANACTNVVAVNKGVWETSASANLVRDPYGPESFVSLDEATGRSNPIGLISLDSFFESAGWPRVDLVKMNIEGSELWALRGMRSVCKRNPAIQLAMEFNPTAMIRSGVSRHDLATILAELGFRRARVVERNLTSLPSGELLPADSGVYNIFLTK